MSLVNWEQTYLDTHTCPFRKYRGDGWIQVIQLDRDYVRWLLENLEDMDEELREALTWGVEYVPDRI